MKRSRTRPNTPNQKRPSDRQSTSKLCTLPGIMQATGKDNVKRRKIECTSTSSDYPPIDYMAMLSLESICNILSYLPFYDVMKLAHLCHKLHEAVILHLRLRNEIDFTEGEIYGWMPVSFNDLKLKKLLSYCPNLIQIHGLHPSNLSKRRHIASDTLSVPGIIDALTECKHLDYVDTSDIFVLEAILLSLPHVSVGDFRNRNGHFPVPASNKLSLVRSSTLTTLQLHGATIVDLPRMENLQHLHLRFVKLTAPQPFRDFVMPLLQSFVMAHCAGPPDALKYVPMVTGLAAAEHLSRLELIRVPFLGGLFQHVVEDRWRSAGFQSLEKITLGACKNALEVDLGYLLIACSRKITELSLQPSLTKDSFFMSLIWTDVDFVQFETLNLGFVDAFPETGKWTNEELHTTHGLADVLELPAMLTDIGMLAAGRVFYYCKNLSIYNAPHLHHPTSWMHPDESAWTYLHSIHIRRCHAVWLADFCSLLPQLSRLESLVIEDMFREPPRGCARVGLSAGTGLGVSSALVTNTGNETPQAAAANQQQPNNAGAEAANQGEANNEAPANQQAANNIEANQAADNIETDQAASNNQEEEIAAAASVKETDLEENTKNLALSGGSGSSCGEIIDPDQPSCSSAPTGTTVLPDEVKKENNKDMEKDIANKDEADMEYDIVTIATASMCSHCGCVVPGKSEGKSEGVEESPKGKGKGKSLRGKKKGIAKGSSGVNSKQVHQSCQAIGEEIREASKKAKESEEAAKTTGGAIIRGKCEQTASDQSEKRTQNEAAIDSSQSNERRHLRSDTLSNQSKGSLQNGAKVGDNLGDEKITPPKKKVPTQHKSTSTSDPVVEDDFIPQVFTLRSTSLVSLSLRKVGVTELLIEDCPRLQIVSATACRVLRGVTVRLAPRLTRVTLTQCPRLEESHVAEQLCAQPAERNRLIITRPMQAKYEPLEMERAMFRNTCYDYHLCVIHDYSSDPAATLYNRRRVASWLDLLSNTNFELLRFMEFPEAQSSSIVSSDDAYPWGRRLIRMQGHNANGSKWELMTDIPWLHTLATAPDLPNSTMEPDDNKPGVYSPRAKGHYNTDACLDALAEDIAEARECQHTIYNYTVVIYVNMCDHSKRQAVHDVYV